MTEKPEASKAEPAAQSGVFGNLPDARPGTRSPRRKSGAKGKTEAKAKPATKAKAEAKARRPAPPPKVPATDSAPPPPPRAAEPSRPASQQQPGGLADVAWAGIAVAAEAATIGVRLASRAIEAVRGNPERD